VYYLRMSEQSISPQRIFRAGVSMLRKEGQYKDPQAYDFVVDKFLGRSKLAADMADCLQKYVPCGLGETKVLDEASGTGAISLNLASRGYKTFASDISQEMIVQLQSKATEKGVSIESALANSNTTLPYKDRSFSAVVTASANRYITDLDTFLREVNRVLDVGGYFIWPILGADIIPWKRNAGLNQPTLSHNLAKEMEKHGFKVKTDMVGSLFRNTLNGVPAYAIPTYLIGQKLTSGGENISPKK